jgi:hypothetical protein
MNTDKYREFLLANIPSARPAGGNREIVCRCFECGDSQKDSQGHMYISIPQNNDEPSLFYCHRAVCQASGVVTHKKLMEWGLYQQDIAIELAQYNKHVLILDKNKKYNNSKVYSINNQYISNDDLSSIKLRYINKRLGTNLEYNDLLQNKIVLNLKDLLSSNHITEFTRYPNIIDELDKSFVGFISHDNAFVNLRNLTPGKVSKYIDIKYVNYNIFNKFDNTQRFYTIPNNIDLCRSDRIKLHIAEGAFDILSIYYNLRQTKEHSIYSSIGGAGYLGLCRYFIVTLKLLNVEIHLYPDNDIDDYIIYMIADLIRVFGIPLYLHRNTYSGEKDFGVPLYRIRECIYKI